MPDIKNTTSQIIASDRSKSDNSLLFQRSEKCEAKYCCKNLLFNTPKVKPADITQNIDGLSFECDNDGNLSKMYITHSLLLIYFFKVSSLIIAFAVGILFTLWVSSFYHINKDTSELVALIVGLATTIALSFIIRLCSRHSYLSHQD